MFGKNKYFNYLYQDLISGAPFGALKCNKYNINQLTNCVFDQTVISGPRYQISFRIAPKMIRVVCLLQGSLTLYGTLNYMEYSYNATADKSIKII